ncbi:PhaM family polyhydroxyalkanoate granule multifunctional regulatory protein [Rhizobacter sp. OV335]|uniref:PhaM family polyhydroxyalkanoate granule multifunctional regulatory protein n=1 Tax=Rhizobacter sp. OV335 TaxID=1500264 RepID=UPI00091A82AF|nr:PhaM family polyhydroxyalkanoate granule multifunctional regulatory protein [Rhizobacter sp. OV335]SHN02122.1 hypothetical protein SAMN02787076_02953 [Rhizobacter sp. OV335]
MAEAPNFTKLVPGFDFLQGLVKNAGAALPNIGQWVAPTLNPEELEKRIEELRTVQFWLEQNARMLGATIQALEVQRMTLSTLKTMNVQMEDLRDSLTARPAAAPESEPARKPAAKAATAAADPAPVDPMQWWGALTKQFTELAATAMKDSASDAARNLAGALVKQSVDAAGQTLKRAATMPGQMAVKTAKAAAGVAAKTVAKSTARSAAKSAAKSAAARKRAAPRP